MFVSLYETMSKTNIVFFGIIVAITLLIALATYDPHTQTTNPTLNLLLSLHTPLMVLMVLISVAFGYYTSNSLKSEIKEQQTHNKEQREEIVSLLMNTLLPSEKLAFKYLLEGPLTQAELSKKEKMTRLKAHRATQRLLSLGFVKVIDQNKTKHLSVVNSLCGISRDSRDSRELKERTKP